MQNFLIFLPYILLGIISGIFNLRYSLQTLNNKTKDYPLFKPSEYRIRYTLWIVFQVGLPALFFVFTVWLCQTPIIDFDIISPLDDSLQSPITIKQYLQSINYLAFFQVFLYCVLFGISFPVLVNNLDVFTIKATYDAINEILYQHIAAQETSKTSAFELELENYLERIEPSDLNQGIRYLERYFDKDNSLQPEQKNDYLRKLEEIGRINNPSIKAKKIVSIIDIRHKDYPILLQYFNLPPDFINHYFPESR